MTQSKTIDDLHDVEMSDEEEEEQERDSNDSLAEDEGEDDGADADSADGNAGWSDTFAKVLRQQKPKNKKYLVLSRAKKLADRHVKAETDANSASKSISFEIEGDDNSGDDTKSSKIVDTAAESKPSLDELELALLARKERTNKLLELRVKPASMDRLRERGFKRIATKGVVQLFNAVRAQQRDLVDRLEKAGPLDHRRDAVLNNLNKRQFLDVLMGGKRAVSENVDYPVKTEDDDMKPSQWDILRDDFLTNKKTSHWNKEDDDEDVDKSERMQEKNNDESN